MVDVVKLNRAVDSGISRNIDYNKYSVAIMICINRLSKFYSLVNSDQFKSKLYYMILSLRNKLKEENKVNLFSLRKCCKYNCTPSDWMKRDKGGDITINYYIENYDYGSDVEIVDDYSGGSDKALSAERGKELFDLVTNIDCKTY